MNKLRFVAIVLIAVMVAIPPGAEVVYAQAPAPLATVFFPLPGNWTGNTDTGGGVSFVVDATSTSWNSFFMATFVSITGVCTVSHTLTGVAGTVNGLGQISGSDAVLSFSGTFKSTTAISGNYTFNDATKPGCTKTGTWSAALRPVFTAVVPSWDYGLIKVGTTTPAKTFVVKNTGQATLSIGIVSLAGVAPGQFHITANGCSSKKLAPGLTCAVAVTFKPTSVGTKSAYLNFPDNALGSPHKIPLTGKGGAELAINGGFNSYKTSTAKIPTGWTALHFGRTDGKSTTIKKEGTASVRMGNTTAIQKTLTQVRTVGGRAGNTFLFRLWVKGQSIPATGIVQAQVVLYNGTTVVLNQIIALPRGTYGFTQQAVGFTAPGAYTRIVIKLWYTAPTGVAWFDGLSLLRSP